MTQVLKVAVILGEASGDNLAADLWPVLGAEAERRGKSLEFCGLAGPRMEAMGHRSLFDIEEIAVMGFSAVIGRLPKIVRRVYQTVSHVRAEGPDLVLLIDSPDFTHAVAKRLRPHLPGVPIINYVCPSVWAWRSGRAAKMRAYVDHVLALLPFEPKVLAELGGPSATYVGHPLKGKIRPPRPDDPFAGGRKPKLLVLPGSRSGEIKRLLGVFGRTLVTLRERGVEFDALLPAVPHLKEAISNEVANWSVPVRVAESADNERLFEEADAALAASGTVALELAVYRVPMALAYKLDPVARPFAGLVSTWSAALPNLIAGWLLVPEEFNESVKPERLARRVERLLADTPERRAQVEGFNAVAQNMQTDRPTAEIATQAIFDVLDGA